jgi:hypothetical protein
MTEILTLLLVWKQWLVAVLRHPLPTRNLCLLRVLSTPRLFIALLVLPQRQILPMHSIGLPLEGPLHLARLYSLLQ